MKTNKSAETIIVLMLACIIAFLVFHRDFLLWIAVILGLGTLLSNKFATLIHWGWLALGKGLGFITGKIILSVIYFVLVLPVGWLFRKKLTITLKKTSGSYYKERNHLYRKEDIANPW